MARLGSEWADMGATPRAESWRGMRSLRADPPGLAVGDRKATFVMALEQAEQLFIAAENTGPAARPLPLFYGLSQAGRALLATKVPGDPWRPRSHGIGEVRGGVAAPTVADFEVEPKKFGAFPMVAQALSSSGLRGPTRLGDLWTLLPDTSRFEIPKSGPHRLLNVVADSYRTDGTIEVELSGLPPHLGVPRSPDDDPSGVRSDWGEEEARVRDFLSHYPSLTGLRFATGGGQPIGFVPMSGGTARVTALWSEGPEGPRTTGEVTRQVATSYAGYDMAYPCLDGGDRPLHPLTVWWAVLFGLSVLARYEPETWGRAIDVNGSREAVALEYILEAALDSVPELLYRVFTGDA